MKADMNDSLIIFPALNVQLNSVYNDTSICSMQIVAKEYSDL